MGNTDFPVDRPTVPEAVVLAQAVYARPDGVCGCCLHITLDDGNLDNSDVSFCLERAKEAGHLECIACADALVRMTRTQRKKVYATKWRRA